MGPRWTLENLVAFRWKSTSERLVCKTSPLLEDQQTFYELTVSVDNANRTLNSRFDYAPDPRVVSVQPQVAFKSGGRQLIVRGRHFNSIQRPLMFFLDRQTGRLASENSICQVFNATLMLCPSPALLPNRAYRLDRRALRSRESEGSSKNAFSIESVNIFERSSAKDSAETVPDLSVYDRFHVGFVMDAVESVKRLNEFTVTLVPDPVYLPFSNGRKFITRNEPLILEGTDLNLSSSEIDVRVTIGGELCKVTLISVTKLVCQPPFSQIDEQRSKLLLETNIVDPEDIGPLVVVRVGYLEFVLGRLVYDDSDAASMLLAETGASGMWDAALIGAIVGVCVTLSAAAIVAIALWWKRKIWQAEKEYERVRLRMDSLESNVRQECKQAFAELQSDISDLVSAGLGSQGLPYQPRQVFADKILFREDGVTKASSDWQEYDDVLGESVASFEELLSNRRFVSVLIGVLEREHTIDRSDRARVAGLLAASLDRDMHSLTDVVLTLLGNAIARTPQGKWHQNLKEGSIMDALLVNWISLSMYDYLIESENGRGLFLMYKAIKCQSEKGPVDAVTGHARFSLAEETLLKEQSEYESIVSCKPFLWGSVATSS